MDDDAGRVDDGPQRGRAAVRSRREARPLLDAAAAAVVWPGRQEPRRVARGRDRSRPSARPPPRSASDDRLAAVVALERADASRWRSCSMEGMIAEVGHVRRLPARGGVRIPSPVIRRLRAAAAAFARPVFMNDTFHRRRRAAGRDILAPPARTDACSVPAARAVLAVRRPAGGADRRGTGRARSGPAGRAVRAGAPAVLGHGRRSRAFEGDGVRAGRSSLARASAEYREIGTGEQFRHRARFHPRGCRCAARPVGHRRRLRRVPRCSIDDRPVPYARELWLPLFWFLVRALTRRVATPCPNRPNSNATCSCSRPSSEGSRPSTTCSSPASCRGRRWETRAQVEALFRRYDRAYIQSYADRFRFHTLQSRFSTFVRAVGPRAARARGRAAGPVLEAGARDRGSPARDARAFSR